VIASKSELAALDLDKSMSRLSTALACRPSRRAMLTLCCAGRVERECSITCSRPIIRSWGAALVAQVRENSLFCMAGLLGALLAR